MNEPLAIHQRRYIGSKTKLLQFIDEILIKENAQFKSVADIFAGTGVVGHYFNDKAQIILNDNLRSNYIAHQAFLGPVKIRKRLLDDRLEHYNSIDSKTLPENYFSEHFSGTYFSHDNSKRIGYIREDINSFSVEKKLNGREKAYLVAALIYAVDRIANTVGHYDAFRRNGELSRKLELKPLRVGNNNYNNQIFCNDANRLVRQMQSDVVYIDPPYNSRQYSDAYHLLENLATWEKPFLSGVAKKMDRSHIKSKYSLKSAGAAFSDLIDNIAHSTKYILVSYNDMGGNGDPRSQSRISDHDLVSALERKGALKVYEKEFRQFTTGKSSNHDLKERIFFCKVTSKPRGKQIPLFTGFVRPKGYVKSPLNYTGGKYRLMPQLANHFPKEINTFYDVFCGGANVAINAEAKKIIAIDKSKELINLLNYIQKTNFEELHQNILRVISEYNLSQSYLNGYAHYGAESSKGLGQHNKVQYIKLRSDYNDSSGDDRKNLLLLVLILYGFNNQIRFNSKGMFNLPVGKRDYNGSLHRNLSNFKAEMSRKNIMFLKKDFRDLVTTSFNDSDFVYLDPPYLLGLASYNESGGWSEKDEGDLHDVLTRLNGKGVRFALSNVLRHKGETNTLLETWSKKQGLNIHKLNYDYKNSNYQSRASQGLTQEILITNY